MKKLVSLGPVLFIAMFCSLLFAPWAAATPAQQVTLSLSEFAITPSTFTVQQGQPVTFTAKNVGKFPHNVTFELTAQNMKETYPLKKARRLVVGAWGLGLCLCGGVV